MEKQEIIELIRAFEHSQLTMLEYELAGEKLRMEKSLAEDSGLLAAKESSGTGSGGAAAQTANAEPEEQESAYSLKAPLVGIFYRSSSPGGTPFAAIGDTIKKGEVMCIIEAMKVMNEIKAPYDLIVRNISAVDGELVDCGRSLFEVEKC